MNSILQNRALRGFLTLFLGTMLALSIGLAWQSVYAAPPSGDYFDWYSSPSGVAWQSANPEPDPSNTVAEDAWTSRQSAAEQAATEAWQAQRDKLPNSATTWAAITFGTLLLLGIALSVGSTLLRDRLGVLYGGIFLAGVFVIADASILNFNLSVFTSSGGISWTPVVCGWLGIIALFVLGWWKFVKLSIDHSDGQGTYMLIAALAPVYVIGATVAKILDMLHLTDSSGLWVSMTYLISAAMLLSLGLVFSKKLGLLGNIITISAVIMAFGSVFSSFSMQSMGTTAAVGFAAVAFTMFVAWKTLAKRGEKVLEIANTSAAGATTVPVDGERVLVLYAGEKPPSDAVIVEVPLGNGVVYRGFGAYREAQK
jgi:hypothetical protein